MKRLLVVLFLLVVGVVGLGFYLGWFQISTENTGQKSNINLTVDKDKIREDEQKAREKIQEAGKAVREKIGSETK